MQAPQLEKVEGGYRVKTSGDFHLDVRPMMKGRFRLVEIPEQILPGQHGPGRHWCYASFEAAVLAGVAWDFLPDTEPVGWVSRGGSR